MMRIKLDDLMQREVSRKEFLQGLGLILLGIIGFTNILENAHKSFSGSMPPARQEKRMSGYGMSAYGR